MMVMWRVKFVVVLLLYNSLPAKSDGTCGSARPQQVVFSQRAQDFILTGPIVMTKLVSSDQECQMACIRSMKCDTFNLSPLDDSFHYTCQILRFDVQSYIVQRKKGWSFRARKCLSSPCKNGGICFSIDASNTPRCACPSSWKGDICSEPSSCRAGWIEYDIFCYNFFENTVTFSEANSSCVDEGADLVSIKDFDELRFLDSILPDGEKVFVGWTDIAEEGRWVWMDGSVPTLDPLWHGDHPDGGLDENCGEYQQNHGFHDKKCKEKRSYVCKYSL